jgi:hypothetical protein
LWRDPLDSGETPSGLLDVIRESARRRDAFIRARNSVNRKVSKLLRTGDDYQAQVEEKMKELLEETTADYFPDYWLVFATFGPPAPANKQMQIFKLQNIADLQAKIVNVDNKRMNRNSRSTLQGKGGKKKPPTGRSSSSPMHLDLSSDSPLSTTNGLHVTHHIDMSHRAAMSEQVVPTREDALQKLIATLQNAGKLPDGTYVLQEKITKYTNELAELMIQKLDAVVDDEWMTVE